MKDKKEKKKKRGLHWFSKLLILGDLCAAMLFVAFYGPWAELRDWFVTTAMATMNHRYLAYVMYPDTTVKEVMGKNATIESDEQTDASAIKFVEEDTSGVYSSIYEEQILKRDEGNDEYKVIEIREEDYSGFITVIYHPERLKLAISKSSFGSTITEFSKDYNASVAINAGGFHWDAYGRCYTKHNIILNGAVYKSNGKKGKIICMNKDNVLCLMKATAKEAVKAGMEWGVEFGPFLIVNGVVTKFTGNGGYGIHPRTAIGQRKDGIVILITIDGRGANGSDGITIPDLTEIFVRYGCYNAANLDGGGSTMLAIEGKLRNNPKGWGYSGERYIYNAIVLKRPSKTTADQ